jgi:hypothetical protein
MANNLKRAIDTDLSYLCTTERERAMILRNVLEGKKVKKKLSIGLALGIILVILAGTAIALVLSDVFSKEAAVLQEEKGDLNNWSLDDKIALIGTLEESGIPISQEQLQALRKDDVSQDVANRIADEILVEAKTAREALMQVYGFTNETFTFFDRAVTFSLGDDSHDSCWIVTYTPKSYADAVGIYHVTVDAVTGDMTGTSWTYDDITLEDEPANLSASVWNVSLIDRLLAFPAQYEQRRAEMEQTLGVFESWNLEDKATLDKMYLYIGYPVDGIALNVLPDDEDYSYQEAVKQTMASIEKNYFVDVDVLDTWDRHASLFQFADQTEKLWVITLLNPDNAINERYVVELRSPSGAIELCARYLNEQIVQPEQKSTLVETEPGTTSTDEHILMVAWESMKSTYGFEDVTRPYLDAIITKDEEQETYTVAYRSNNYNPRKIGDYTIVLDAETLNILRTDWSLKESYQNQGSTTPWKTADLWSAYEYNQYATLRMETKAIVEQAGDQWSMSFEQQAAYDALYRQAGYDRTQYFHGVPSALDIPLEAAIKIANGAIENQFQIDQNILEQAELTYEFDVSDETLCKWRLRVLVTSSGEETMYIVVIDSRSEKVLSISAQPGSN